MKKMISLLAVVFCFAGIICYGKDAGAAKPSAASAETAQKVKPVMPKLPEIDPKVWDFIPEVVAKVGDKQITKEQLVKTLTPQVKMLTAMGKKFTDEQYQEMAKNMTDELIKVEVLEDLASSAGYKVTPQIENEVYQKFCERFKKQLPEGEKISFEDVIKKQGLDVNDVKKQMAEGEVIQKWIKEKVEPTVKVSDADAKAFYDKNKETFFKKPETVTASHILIKPVLTDKDGKKVDKEKAWAEAKTKADKLYKEVKDGANFAELAKENSEGPSAKNGGKLGTFSKGQMVPEFEKECWKLALAHAGEEGNFNEYGEVKTKFGWHIIDVTGYDKGGYIPLDDKLLDQIKTQLKQEKTAKEIKEMVDAKIKELKPVVNLKVKEPKKAAPVDKK